VDQHVTVILAVFVHTISFLLCTTSEEGRLHIDSTR